MKVKICGLTRLDDAAAVNAARADFAGLVFARSSRRRVSRELAEDLRGALDPAIASVGVFVDEDPREIASLARGGVISMIQLHGSEDARYIETLRELVDAPIIKAFNASSGVDARAIRSCAADLVLLGGATGGGTTDGGATDGGTTDGGAADGGTTDGGATDGGTTGDGSGQGTGGGQDTGTPGTDASGEIIPDDTDGLWNARAGGDLTIHIDEEFSKFDNAVSLDGVPLVIDTPSVSHDFGAREGSTIVTIWEKTLRDHIKTDGEHTAEVGFKDGTAIHTFTVRRTGETPPQNQSTSGGACASGAAVVVGLIGLAVIKRRKK